MKTTMCIEFKRVRFYLKIVFVDGSYCHDCGYDSVQADEAKERYLRNPAIARVVIYPIGNFRAEAPK